MGGVSYSTCGISCWRSHDGILDGVSLADEPLRQIQDDCLRQRCYQCWQCSNHLELLSEYVLSCLLC